MSSTQMPTAPLQYLVFQLGGLEYALDFRKVQELRPLKALERFAAVAAGLRESGRRVTWLLGPAEESVQVPPEDDVLRNPNLAEFAGQLIAAQGYLGNDTGPTHLAALCECPGVAIYGPASHSMWHPLGSQLRTIHGESWPDYDVVLRALREQVGMQNSNHLSK